MTAVLSVAEVVVQGPTGAPWVDGVSLSLTAGERVALIGESGCGKSTVLRVFAGLQAVTQGTLGGSAAHSTRVQWVPQETGTAFDPRLTLYESLMEPLLIHGLAAEAQQRIERATQAVGVPLELVQRWPRETSGGQRQRLALARALVLEPEVLLIDEPTSQLDVLAREQMCRLLQSLPGAMALVVVTHDLTLARALSSRLCVMYAGSVVEQGDTREVLDRPQHPYTRALVDADRPPHPSLAGEPPGPAKRPGGCAFAPRCARVTDRCRTERPSLSAAPHAVACWNSL